MEKSGSDTAFSFPVGPRRIIAARAKLPSPERTLEAGRAKIRLWNERAYRGGQGGRQGSVVGQRRGKPTERLRGTLRSLCCLYRRPVFLNDPPELFLDDVRHFDFGHCTGNC